MNHYTPAYSSDLLSYSLQIMLPSIVNVGREAEPSKRSTTESSLTSRKAAIPGVHTILKIIGLHQKTKSCFRGSTPGSTHLVTMVACQGTCGSQSSSKKSMLTTSETSPTNWTASVARQFAITIDVQLYPEPISMTPSILFRWSPRAACGAVQALVESSQRTVPESNLTKHTCCCNCQQLQPRS